MSPAVSSAAPPVPADSLTPAMRQYTEQKRRVGDAILLFRMGDFYETFYDDAVLCSKTLGIALTSRSKGENPIPLAGIPYHALDSYLRKLVAAGFRVAISEQLEDARAAKGVVKRDVVRIVTAGTLTEDSLLDERDVNILAAVCIRAKQAGLAWIELASGRFEAVDLSREGVLDELVRLRPAELLIDDERGGESDGLAQQLHELTGVEGTRRPAHEFANYQAEKTLKDHFQVLSLAGFGFDAVNTSLCAAGAILQYLQETQKTALTHVTAIRRRLAGDCLQMDHATFRSLEIERTLRGGAREGTLLHAIDRTVHPIGARLLKQWIIAPLLDPSAIRQRQDAVSELLADDVVRQSLRTTLKRTADIERIAGRIALNRASPRDLAALSVALTHLPLVSGQLTAGPRGTYLEEITHDLQTQPDLADLLRRSIRPDAPLSTNEGGFIADGFDAELDRLRSIGTNGQGWLADYQQRETKRAGLASLKVGFNRVFGYYIEVPHRDAEKVPPDFVRRQTVKNAERYITDELKQYETEVLTAQERANELEARLFQQIRGQTAEHLPALLKTADAIGRLDCLAAFAQLAVERRYVRPEVVEDGRLEIREGRHPVLEQTLHDAFVPNDTAVAPNDALVFVITGPNMAGKSTYIRQVALLTVLAQVGSFVPAAAMTWSVVDRLFARVGSSDEIMRGQSTFMVEMTEAANILHYATQRSLVILDELGRGTSTFDGLALAWAITEHLANVTRCRTFVATHYHELTSLAEMLSGVRNLNVAVREYACPNTGEQRIAFLHRIVEGTADQSYGIHVAKLAGIPEPVVRRSREVLAELQKNFAYEAKTPGLSGARTRTDPQLPLFRDPAEELLNELEQTDPNQLSPIAALQKLGEWKSRFDTRQ